MTQRKTPALMSQRREASARYRMAKRLERPIVPVKPVSPPERDDSQRMPWPHNFGRVSYSLQQMGSSLSDPDSPYRVASRGRGGAE